MAAKRLVVAVDGTAATGPYWSTIVSDYLEKIVRHFCPDQSNEQVATVPELGLVQYGSHGPSSGCLVQSSPWTQDADTFLQWLSALTFIGGGDNEAAIAEGLAEALTMFPKPPNDGDQKQLSGENHCILVAASSPYCIPMPLYIPVRKFERSSGIETEWCVVDAQAAARSFPECSVSLSVISPKKFPKLGDIYKAGNKDHEGTPSFITAKNPHFLVLISKQFTEACAALSQSTTDTLPSDVQETKATAPLLPLDSDLERELSEEDSVWLRELLVEPAADDHADSIPAETDTTAVCPQPPAAENTAGESSGNAGQKRSAETPLSQVLETLNGGRNTRRASMFLPAVASYQPPEVQPTRAERQGPCQSMGSLPMVAANQSVVQPFSSIQRPLGPCSPRHRARPRSFSGASAEQEARRGARTNLIGAFGGLREPSSAGTSVSMARMAPQVHGAGTSFPVAHEDDPYVLAWEGSISARFSEQEALVTGAKAYRKISAPYWLTRDWPQTLHIGNILQQAAVNRSAYQGSTDVVTFEVVNYHALFQHLKSRQLCVRIRLPSQSMIFAPAEYNRFTGMVFPLDGDIQHGEPSDLKQHHP